MRFASTLRLSMPPAAMRRVVAGMAAVRMAAAVDASRPSRSR